MPFCVILASPPNCVLGTADIPTSDAAHGHRAAESHKKTPEQVGGFEVFAPASVNREIQLVPDFDLAAAAFGQPSPRSDEFSRESP